MSKRVLLNIAILVIGIVLGGILQPFNHLSVSAQTGCQTFHETGKTVCGRFLDYWQQNGGLAQQGYPLTGQFQEKSDLNGQTYTVQYFERAVFELHPENQPPNDVLLSQLGTFQLKEKYAGVDPSVSGGSGAPGPTQPSAATAQQPVVVSAQGQGKTNPFTLAAGSYQVDFKISGSDPEYDTSAAAILEGVSNGGSYSLPEVTAKPGQTATSTTHLNNIPGGQYYVQVFTGDDPQWSITFTPFGSGSPAATATSPPQNVAPPASTPTNTAYVPPTTAPAPTQPPRPTSIPTDSPRSTPVPTSQPSGTRCGAICNDGTSSTATGSGACSHHGGVNHWIYCDLVP